MPEAIPTPYDITDIPVVPWAPGSREWILVCGIALLGALIIFVTRRKNRSRKRTKVVDLFLQEVDHATRGGAPAQLERLAHLSRRIVEYMSQREISTLSPSELEQASKESSSPSLAIVLRELAEFEVSMYERPSPEHHDKTATSAERLARAVRVYVESARRS